MNLKIMVPLLILVLFIVFTSGIGIYIQKNATDFYQTVEKREYPIEHKIIMKAISGKKNIDLMIKEFDEISDIYRFNITVYDEDGEELHRSHYILEDVFFYRTDKFMIVTDTETYKIKAEYPIILNVNPYVFSHTLRNVIISSLTILLIIIIIINYITILSPLNKIRKSIEKINYGNTDIIIDYNKNNEIGTLCRQFEAMGKRLKESYTQQNEIIAAISHDIRTPLTSIMGYIERMSIKNLTQQKTEEYLDIAYRKAKDIECLLEELTDYSMNEVEQENERQIINIIDFFEKEMKLYKTEMDMQHIQFEYKKYVGEEANVNVNTRKLKRVFTNLIENAKKYAEKEDTYIRISIKKEKDCIFFTVEDNGEGVSFEEMHYIFYKFYRTEKSRSRSKGGTGLGLTICKNIIEKHGGEIWATKSKLGGLAISFYLPIEKI